MHITTADVISASGKITKGEADNHSWTSAADWKHFQVLRDSHELIIMGRTTYDVIQPAPEAARLRVVLTRHPVAYKEKEAEGQLEFMNKTPKQLIAHMEARGFAGALLVGGQVNTAFWDAGLVDEVYITVEPVVFGEGKGLLENADFDAQLRLQSVKQLNERGTLLLHYLVDKGQPVP